MLSSGVLSSSVGRRCPERARVSGTNAPQRRGSAAFHPRRLDAKASTEGRAAFPASSPLLLQRLLQHLGLDKPKTRGRRCLVDHRIIDELEMIEGVRPQCCLEGRRIVRGDAVDGGGEEGQRHSVVAARRVVCHRRWWRRRLRLGRRRARALAGLRRA